MKRYIYNKVEWREEMERGKMFGVLIVAPNNLPLGEENARGLHFLTAYSGQILGRSDWEGFVPPVFDYLQPDGYFKTEERAIEQLNQRIAELSAAPERMRLKRAITHQLKEQEETLSRMRKMMEASKLLRHQRRQEARLSEQEKQELEHESQYQKAQYKRVRKNFSDEIARLQGDMTILNSAIEEMEKERKTRSRALQQWLFSHFMMLNDRGEQRSLLDLFSETTFPLPPAGAGECCEPKLLQYAFAHGLRPLAMAMFWYGGHSLTEVRLHGHFYPACAGKCRPILRWMLAHLCDFSNDREELSTLEVPEVVYEDDSLLVVNKPAGLLTVPGIETRHSVFSIFRQRYPDTDSPLIVHRLDQATSGLLVLAKTRTAYVALQRQFIERTVVKRYVAIVEGVPAQRQGVISLPLRPDLFDRPRQLVDWRHGKEAVTEYRVTKVEDGKTWLQLHPLTGRTHQLRVHCAHPDGLRTPIVGDELYGNRSDRMYLHAEYLEFIHPVTGKRLSFSCPFRTD